MEMSEDEESTDDEEQPFKHEAQPTHTSDPPPQLCETMGELFARYDYDDSGTMVTLCQRDYHAPC